MWILIGLLLTVAACGFPKPRELPVSDSGVSDPPDAPSMCMQPACVGAELFICGASGSVVRTETCNLGCYSDGSRCNKVAPSNGLGDYLDQSAQQNAVMLSAGSLLDTDTGAVTSARGSSVPVFSALVAQPDGAMLRVWLARAWTIEGVRIRGSLPAAFVSSGAVVVDGLIDASADGATGGPGAMTCGTGSGDGGVPSNAHFERAPATNSGGYPAFLWVTNGFGGGGFGTSGGAGGVEFVSQAGAGGGISGNAELTPLRGGCAGGGSTAASRGAGGGAVQLVSAESIHLVSSGSFPSAGVHVGGGGGAAGALGHVDSNDMSAIYGPGGGGAGGGILIEAPHVVLDAGSVLLAAGGAGAGYGACSPPPNGVDASAADVTPSGGACPPGTSPSAVGGSGATSGDGAPGGNSSAGSAGSGGGGLGRIRINTADPNYTPGRNVLLRGSLSVAALGRR